MNFNMRHQRNRVDVTSGNALFRSHLTDYTDSDHAQRLYG